MRRQQARSPRLKLASVAECTAEKALAGLIINRLGLNKKPNHAGGHERAIKRAKELATKEVARLVLLVIDYERGAEAERKTRSVCDERNVRIYQVGRGARMLLCVKQLSNIPVLVVVWDPRSEDVIRAAIGPLGRDDYRKIKSDEKFVREKIKSSPKLLSIVEEASVIARSLLEQQKGS